MKLVLKFETRELSLVKEHTYYNHLCHKLKHPQMGITHLLESYDDVSFHPSYDLGTFNNGKFEGLLYGEGDPIPKGCENMGGVWVEIEIFNPEHLLGVKNYGV